MSKKPLVHILRTAQARADGTRLHTMCGIVTSAGNVVALARFREQSERGRCRTCEKIAVATGALPSG